MNLLIVDDNVDSVQSAADFLGLSGYKTDTAYSGHGAEALMEQRPRYDVAIFDYRIMDITGLDLVRWMRTRDITTPAIIVTGVAGNVVDLIRMCVTAEKLEPVVVLAKPYEADVLIEAIEALGRSGEGSATVADPRYDHGASQESK